MGPCDFKTAFSSRKIQLDIIVLVRVTCPLNLAWCIGCLLLYNKLPQILAALSNTHYLQICGSGSWVWLSWVLSLWASHGLQSTCELGLQSHLKAHLGLGDLTPVVVGRISFPTCNLLRVSFLCWLLARGLPYPLTPRASPEGAHNMAAGFLRAQQVPGQKSCE